MACNTRAKPADVAKTGIDVAEGTVQNIGNQLSSDVSAKLPSSGPGHHPQDDIGNDLQHDASAQAWYTVTLNDLLVRDDLLRRTR